MRRVLEIISVAGLIFIWVATAAAVAGPYRLPAHIPTHFDLAGRPNGWSTAGMLWIMPGIVTAVYALMTWVAGRPAAFNYPTRLTPASRPRMQALGTAMILWLKTELVLLFAWIQFATIRAARTGHAPGTLLAVPAGIAIIWITIGWYMVKMIRAGRRTPQAR